MNKEEARKEYIKIIQERNAKAEVIIAEAKKKGTWENGLDSNKALFKGIDEEAKRKIDSLKSKVTEK